MFDPWTIGTVALIGFLLWLVVQYRQTTRRRYQITVIQPGTRRAKPPRREIP